MFIQDEARQLLISYDFEFLHLVSNASLLERGKYFVFLHKNVSMKQLWLVTVSSTVCHTT